MKRMLVLLLLLVACNVSAIEIKSSLSGSWYNPNQSGHGLSVEVISEEETVIYWYVYHTDGTPMFLVTVGTNQGNRTTGTTYYHTGMKFGDFDPNDVQQTVWGTSTVTFSDCNTATLRYSSNDPAYGSGSIQMVRLAFISGSKCTDSPLHGNYNGSWADSGEVGYGLAALFANGDMLFFSESSESAGVGAGQWRVTGSNRFAFDVTVYFVSGGTRNVSGNGVFNEDDLAANYTGNGTLFGTPISSFQHSLSAAKLAGNYKIYDWNDLVVGSVTVQNNGKITGTTNDGCKIEGDFIVPDTNFNQAYVDADILNCGTTVRVLGAAVYRNAINEIVVAAFDGWYGYVWTLK